MSTWIASNHPDSPGLGRWHVGIESRAYTDRTRRLVGVTLRTRCSNRQLGGPWGYSRTTNPDHVQGNECVRCAALHAADMRAFRAKAREWLTR